MNGNNVYNFNGSDQRVAFDLQPGGPKANVEVTYKNRSDKTRSISVAIAVTEGDADAFVVKVFKGDKNITHLVVGGAAKTFRAKPPGSKTPPLRIQVRMRASAAMSETATMFVRGAYGKNYPVCGDAVAVTPS